MSFTLVPAVGERFFDREEILEEMLETLGSSRVYMGFALIGSRRIGKTSILKEVCRILNQNKKIAAVYISFWDLDENTVDEFCKKIIEKTLEVFKQRLSLKYRLKNLIAVPASKILEFLKTIGVQIKVLHDIEIKVYTEKARGKAAGEKVEAAMNLIDKLAYDMKVKAVLIMDEFPSIMELKNGEKAGPQIIRKVRTLQEDYKNTVLCISGSIKRTMDLVVLDESSAFYRQFIIKQIGPFSKKVIKKLLEKNLGMQIGEEALDKVYSKTSGIPFYVQFLGRGIERKKTTRITSQLIEEVYIEFLTEEGGLIFSQEFQKLTDREKEILLNMAKKDFTSPAELSQELKESANLICRYLEYLILKGLITKKEKGSYEIFDPCFEDWLRKKD